MSLPAPEGQIVLGLDGMFFFIPLFVIIHRPFEKKIKDKSYHGFPSTISPVKYSWKYSIAFAWVINMDGIINVDGAGSFVFAENGDILYSNRRPA